MCAFSVGGDAALEAKSCIDERNDIHYGTDVLPEACRPDNAASYPNRLRAEYGGTGVDHALWQQNYDPLGTPGAVLAPADLASVPEPASVLILPAGLGLLGRVSRLRGSG